MPDFTLRQLECFVAVAEHSAITRAAAALHMSPSAVGAAVEELERHLGQRLTVRRRSHGVTLTTSGQTLLPRARRILAAARELEGPSGRLSGRLALGCYESVAAWLLPNLIEGFEALHPDVRIEIVDGPQDMLLTGLASGRLDVAIVHDADITGELATCKLYSLRPYVLLQAGHPLSASGKVRLEDIIDEPLAQLDAHPGWQLAQELLSSRGLRPNLRYVTRNYELLRSLVSRGLAYSLQMQRPATDRTHEGGRVVACEIDPAPAPIPMLLAWPRQGGSSALEEFVSWAPGRVREWRTES